MRSSRLVSAGLAVAGLVLVFAFSANAQIDDHLRCYRISDPLKLEGIVNLDSKQFGIAEGCEIGQARLFCVPDTKKVVAAFGKGGPIDPLSIFGPAAPGDRICYQLHCDVRPVGTVDVADQFGERTIKVRRPRWLCTPAVKVQEPAECEDSLDFPTCGAPCPDSDARCVPANDGTARCVCEKPAPQCSLNPNGICAGPCPLSTQRCVTFPNGCDCVTPCGPDAAGQCGGFCPNPNDRCQVTAAGDCGCGPTIDRCSLSPDGVCAGLCPVPTQICQTFPGGCDCVTPCGPDPVAGQCSGFCPNPNDRCQVTTSGECGCGPTIDRCSFSPAGLCGGACPIPGQICATFPNGCDCVDPCRVGPDGSCGGACPLPNQRCSPTSAAGECDCVSFCSPGPDGICGGSCPAPDQICATFPGGCDCVPSCAVDVNGVCGGFCPDPADVCQPTATGDCLCAPVQQRCEDGPFPTCNGLCPLDQRCVPDDIAGTETCVCQKPPPPVCELVTDDLGNVSCAGSCPVFGIPCQLRTDPTGAVFCSCDGVDCGASGPTCDGPCPVGTTCRPIPDANACLCVN